jgi:hypothetical protein
MNILMILDGEFPPDERVEKEAISLIGRINSEWSWPGKRMKWRLSA